MTGGAIAAQGWDPELGVRCGIGAKLTFGMDPVVCLVSVWRRAGGGAWRRLFETHYPEMVSSQERAWFPQRGEKAGRRAGLGEGLRCRKRWGRGGGRGRAPCGESRGELGEATRGIDVGACAVRLPGWQSTACSFQKGSFSLFVVPQFSVINTHCFLNCDVTDIRHLLVSGA